MSKRKKKKNAKTKKKLKIVDKKIIKNPYKN